MLMRRPRFAIYFAPPAGSAWSDAGARWLGRCSDTGRTFAQTVPAGWRAEVFHQITAQPWRYGWHGTLKAPFHLAAGLTQAGLHAAVDALAADFSAFDLPPLTVQRLGHFLALRPTPDSAEINALAQCCVRDLQVFSAKPSEAEIIERIAKDQLDAQEQALLWRWGYPHVMERFRFHMTLTGPLASLSAVQIAQLEEHAQNVFSALAQPLRVEALSLFIEPHRGADFQRIAVSPLAQ